MSAVCPAFADLVHEVADGTASAADAAQFAAHAAACPACAASLAASRRDAAALRGARMVTPPGDLVSVVVAALAAEDAARGGAWWRALAVGASSVAAGALLLADPAGLSAAFAAMVERADALAAAAPVPQATMPAALETAMSGTLDAAQTQATGALASLAATFQSVPSAWMAGVGLACLALAAWFGRRRA